MVQFFPRVAEQIGEVLRIEQRCARRIKRFFAAGTAEQARGLARQINDAIGVGHALLRQSVVDSPTRAELPIGRSALTSVGAIAFDIQDPSPPRPALQAESTADLSGFTGLASQVDIPQLTELVNTAVQAGPVSLPEMIGMVDAPYLGDVVVLWALAVRQDPDAAASAAASRVRFRSRDGVDREIEVPALMFRDRVPSAGGL